MRPSDFTQLSEVADASSELRTPSGEAGRLPALGGRYQPEERQRRARPVATRRCRPLAAIASGPRPASRWPSRAPAGFPGSPAGVQLSGASLPTPEMFHGTSINDWSPFFVGPTPTSGHQVPRVARTGWASCSPTLRTSPRLHHRFSARGQLAVNGRAATTRVGVSVDGWNRTANDGRTRRCLARRRVPIIADEAWRCPSFLLAARTPTCRMAAPNYTARCAPGFIIFLTILKLSMTYPMRWAATRRGSARLDAADLHVRSPPRPTDRSRTSIVALGSARRPFPREVRQHRL